MVLYIILSLHVDVPFQLPGEHTALALLTCRTTIAISLPTGTHLHKSEVKHLRVKCLAQRHNIDTTMSQH